MAGIPDSVRHKFQRIIETSKADERFKKIMANGNDDNFKWAYEFAYERAHGKAVAYTELSGPNGTPLSGLTDDQFKELLKTRKK